MKPIHIKLQKKRQTPGMLYYKGDDWNAEGPYSCFGLPRGEEAPKTLHLTVVSENGDIPEDALAHITLIWTHKDQDEYYEEAVPDVRWRFSTPKGRLGVGQEDAPKQLILTFKN